jgi:hypothetical protein
LICWQINMFCWRITLIFRQIKVMRRIIRSRLTAYRYNEIELKEKILQNKSTSKG